MTKVIHLIPTYRDEVVAARQFFLALSGGLNDNMGRREYSIVRVWFVGLKEEIG